MHNFETISILEEEPFEENPQSSPSLEYLVRNVDKLCGFRISIPIFNSFSPKSLRSWARCVRNLNHEFEDFPDRDENTPDNQVGSKDPTDKDAAALGDELETEDGDEIEGKVEEESDKKRRRKISDEEFGVGATSRFDFESRFVETD